MTCSWIYGGWLWLWLWFGCRLCAAGAGWLKSEQCLMVRTFPGVMREWSVSLQIDMTWQMICSNVLAKVFAISRADSQILRKIRGYLLSVILHWNKKYLANFYFSPETCRPVLQLLKVWLCNNTLAHYRPLCLFSLDLGHLPNTNKIQ